MRLVALTPTSIEAAGHKAGLLSIYPPAISLFTPAGGLDPG